jgi:hypothetical protein
MDYHPDSDVPIPYLNDTFIERVRDATSAASPKKNVCMFISSLQNESNRIEYLKTLMQQIHIDSYGKLFHNTDLENDKGYKTKQTKISEYKFVIAFENAIYDDYVTEKFYDPLLVGSIPVYLGAPNIDSFSPGQNSFVDVRDYPDPKALAFDLNRYCQNNKLTEDFYQWKNKPLNDRFVEIAKLNATNPFEKLITKIENYKCTNTFNKPIEIKIGKGILKGS